MFSKRLHPSDAEIPNSVLMWLKSHIATNHKAEAEAADSAEESLPRRRVERLPHSGPGTWHPVELQLWGYIAVQSFNGLIWVHMGNMSLIVPAMAKETPRTPNNIQTMAGVASWPSGQAADRPAAASGLDCGASPPAEGGHGPDKPNSAAKKDHFKTTRNNLGCSP